MDVVALQWSAKYLAEVQPTLVLQLRFGPRPPFATTPRHILILIDAELSP
jgi:hypothetical protein